MTKKKTTKTTKKAGKSEAKPKPKKPRSRRGVQTEIDGSRPERDVDLDAIGEEYVDSVAAKGEAAALVKRLHEQLIGQMEAKRINSYVLADGTRLEIVDKGDAVRMKHPRKSKRDDDDLDEAAE